MEVIANAEPQNWAATWAETSYELFNPVNSFPWDEDCSAVAYIPMMFLEQGEQDGLDEFGNGIPSGRE